MLIPFSRFPIMTRWAPTTPPPAPRRWQSRAEILKAHLDSLSPLELLRVRPDLYALTWGWDFENKRYASGRLSLYEERRAGFNPSQPRVPAGNPDGGEWTREGGGSLRPVRLADAGRTSNQLVATDATDDPIVPGAQYAAGPRRRPLPLHIQGPSEGSTYRPGQITIVNKAQTGMSTVDETTEKLRTILEKVVNLRGEGDGPEYGTAIHHDFGDAAKKDENLRNIKVEHTYPEGEGTRYGSKGTIRTDVVLRNDGGEVIAIYDVKTGGAYLDAKRVAQLRAKTGASLSIPVIEMHIQRGLSLKSTAVKARYLWIITLRLWNPWFATVRSQGAGAGGF